MGCLLVAFSGTALAQSQQAAWAKAEQEYGLTLEGAKQVIVYAPLLSDGSFVNAMKAPLNLGIPVNLVTSQEGIGQSNGHLFSLVLLGAKTYLAPRGKSARIHYQVLQRNGSWKVYDFTSGLPKPISYGEVQTFNTWYAKTVPTLRPVDPVAATIFWTKKHTGYQLNPTGGFRTAPNGQRP